MAGSPRKPYKRCHWYDDDGNPRSSTAGIGCTRSNCHFVHPDDKEWQGAALSYPPSNHLLRQPPSDRKERDPNLRPPSTYSNLPAGTASSSSSSAFPERKSSISSLRQSSMDSTSLRKDSYDKIPPSSSRSSLGDLRDRERVRRESGGSARDTRGSERKDELRREESRRDEPRRDETRREESRSERRLSSRDSGRIANDEKWPEDRRSAERRSEDRRPSTSEKRDSVSSAPSLSRAIPPSSSDAMPPPTVKSMAHSSTTTQLREREDKLDQWVLRIKELTSAVSTRIETLKLEGDLAGLKRVTASRQFFDMSDQTQRKLKKQVGDVETRLKAMRDNLNDIVNRLVDSDFWPMPPRPSGKDAVHATDDDKFREMRLTVMSLKGKIKEIEEERQKTVKLEASVLKNSAKLNSGLPTPTLPASTSTPTLPVSRLDAMDVDEQRPAKRRRVSEERDQPQQSEQPSAEGSTSGRDFDALFDRLNAFEEKLVEIENEMVTFDQTISSVVEDRLEDRFGDLTILPGGSRSGEAVGGAGPIDTGQLTGKLHELEVEFGQAANEIKELADTMASMFTELTVMREENTHVRTENERMKATIAKWEERQNATEEMLKEQKSEIRALNAALTAYISRPPDPVPPPILPDTQMLAEALRPSIVSSVRQEIEPMLHNLHGDVQKILVDHTTEITGNVMAKLIVVLKTQAAIQEFMENERRAASLPAPSGDPGPHTHALTHINGTTPVNGAPASVSKTSPKPSPPPPPITQSEQHPPTVPP